MKRKLTLAMLLSLSFASPLSLALGLGEAEIASTLGSPLRVNIPLTDSAGLEPGLLDVSLADDDAFGAAGLSRTPLAASVQVDVMRRRGRLMLDLSTERAVREPWVDLLLRLDWPGGRQLHEVTLLLDPPEYDRLPVLVAGSAAPSATPSSAAASGERAATHTADAAPHASAVSGAGDPAWVRPGDTLWAVAARLRPDSGISMDQMMVALVDANPEVFPSGNVNAMRAGRTLSVPPREAITARSAARADALVEAMNQAWAKRGGGTPAPVPLGVEPETAVADASSQAPSSTPDAAIDPAAARAAVNDASGGESAQRLTLLSDAEMAAERGLAAKDEIAGADDLSVSNAIGSAQGSALSLALLSSPQGEGAYLDPAVLAMIRSDGEVTGMSRLEARWQEARETLTAVREERDALQAQLGDLRAELGAMRERLANLAGASGDVEPGSASSPADTLPWWSALYRGVVEWSLVLGGASLALLLALLALVRWRRREQDMPAPIFSEALPEGVVADVGALPDDGGRGRDEGHDGNGEAARAPLYGDTPGRATMPEAEAISEADIFIAYGRYDQARELLEASLAREPGRDDLRLKLLRVHLEQGDGDAAARQAEQLRAGGDRDVQAEVAKLMPDHEPQSPSPELERALFAGPDDHPSRRIDEPGGMSGSVGTLAFDEAPDMASVNRHPEPDTVAATSGGEREDGQVSMAEASATPREAVEPDHGAEARSASVLAETSLETVQADDGSDIIDYRPPVLEANPAPREETPMQPSVDFTAGDLGDVESPSVLPADASGRDAAAGWEVEEVAFPPLSRDNAHFSAQSSSSSDLAEARRLLDVGDRGQARALLENLIDESGDPQAREEARDLLDQYQS